MNRCRRRWPKNFRPSEVWYHDAPTVIIAFLKPLNEVLFRRSSASRVRVDVNYVLVGSILGFAWHIVSVLTLARRVPTYNFHRLSLDQIGQIATVAAAEEIIWSGSDQADCRCFRSVGFGFTHLSIGSVKGALHMTLFALIARELERKGGLLSSIVFHSAYNLAYSSDSYRS